MFGGGKNCSRRSLVTGDGGGGMCCTGLLMVLCTCGGHDAFQCAVQVLAFLDFEGLQLRCTYSCCLVLAAAVVRIQGTFALNSRCVPSTLLALRGRI